MPSVRPSVFNQRERADGGPFLLNEPSEEDDGSSVDVFFTETPPEQREGEYPIKYVRTYRDKVWTDNLLALPECA